MPKKFHPLVLKANSGPWVNLFTMQQPSKCCLCVSKNSSFYISDPFMLYKSKIVIIKKKKPVLSHYGR